MTVKLVGGTATNLVVSYGGLSYQYSGKGNPNVSFVTFSHLAPDLIMLTRNATPCAGVLKSCEVIIKGKDATGNEISLALPVM